MTVTKNSIIEVKPNRSVKRLLKKKRRRKPYSWLKRKSKRQMVYLDRPQARLELRVLPAV